MRDKKLATILFSLVVLGLIFAWTHTYVQERPKKMSR